MAQSLAESVATALRRNEYDQDAIELLESYVAEQVEQNTYDFVANKALLKLYQFFPARTNEHMVALILTKALMALPSTDMTLLLYLVPDTVRAKEPILTLVRCHEHLETGKFVEFWEVANLGGNELLDAIHGFDEAMRQYMISVLCMTFQSLESEVFMDLVALPDEHLAEYVGTKSDVMRLEGKQVIFVENPQNQPQPKTFKENISFDHLAPVMSLLTSPSS
eukprot:CAMPEP_0118973920 /NCGR_PEP_ID=MMETSP1173-20130426/10976_1 /TAXON_ID=1034831 /ORGANISM="Rhizochromulina marina cf, Strain CCMP1243" /LENGTH=221 /DNA_ID=CAMNT_0006923617 /DNA_START=18 /DNA_END=683 /DNA_ORIENTATION=-